MKPKTTYEMYKFASCPGFSKNYDEKVQMLAGLAFKEQWHFSGEKESNKEILFKYIHHTFNRLFEEWKNARDTQVKNSKICLYNDDKNACFNTGLYTENYESIYGLFARNTNQRQPLPWYFIGFKRKSELFHPILPTRANYFDDISSIIFDFRLTIRIDCEHILKDNKSRLPLELRNIQNLGGAVEMTKKRIAANYRLAVPQYFRNRIQLLIPLFGSDPDDLNVKAVIPVEKFSSSGEAYYLGRTCLTMDMAYNNARLIAKLDSNWLKPRKTANTS